jgi:hypothetical protein
MDMAVNPVPTQNAMDRPVVLRWWHRRAWQRLLGAGVALLLAVTAAVLLSGPAQRSLRVPVGSLGIASVEQGIYHDFIPLRGEVVPRVTRPPSSASR